MEWFSLANLIWSPWNDLNSNSLQHFRIVGDFSRYFEVSGHYGSCSTDTGWLIIASSTECEWESRLAAPNIQYSKLKTRVDREDYGN